MRRRGPKLAARVAPAVWCGTALLGALSAQTPRLVDAIEAPLAYLCLEGGGGGAAGPAGSGQVQRLLADPSLDALFGPTEAGTADGARKNSAPGRVVALVRGVVARSSGDLEIALTGIVTGSVAAGTPLLVLRARLQPKEAERLATLLADPNFALPQRQLGGRQTYRLRGENTAVGGGEPALAAEPGPGELVELALLGTDLIAGNDGSAMRELLTPPVAATSSTPARRVLSGDAKFRMMQKELQTAPGSLWIYGDWQRLGQRVENSVGGLPGYMLGASGLGSARAVMIAVTAQPADSSAGSSSVGSSPVASFSATLLLDFVAPQRGRDGGAAARPGGLHGPGGIDGWFAAALPVPARTLAADLPSGGLGGLVLSVDLENVVARSHEGNHLVRDLRHAFDDYGLDFDRNVRARLGARGTVQFHVGDRFAGASGARGAADVACVYSLRAKDKKAAADLFTDLRRVVEAADLGRLLPSKNRAPELLELRGRHRESDRRPESGCVLTVFDDSLLLAADADTLLQVHEDLRRGARPKGRRDQFVSSRVQTIGGENVAGLFDVDLQPLFEQITQVFAGAGAAVDLSSLPRRHVGYVDVPDFGARRGTREDGSMVRVRVLSSQ